jgi:cell division protein FtsL
LPLSIDAILETILKQGLVGAILILALVMLYRLVMKYDEVQEKRIAEGLANQKLMADLTQSVKDLTRAMQDRNRRA